MKTNFELIKEFHHTFNRIKDPDKPKELDVKNKILRMNLIMEETKEVMDELGLMSDDNEFIQAYKGASPFEMTKLAKELSDLLYVVYGTAASFGIPIDDVFREVHNSNMSKLSEDGSPIYREDGKILKGSNYKPADIKKVFDNVFGENKW